MLSLDIVPTIKYADPWNASLETRLSMLMKGSIRVAYFYEIADNSTFRYRVYNMAQVLNKIDHEVSASYFFLNDLHRLGTIADCADLLVVCRVRYDNRVNHLITAFKKRQKRVIFDIDDFVFNTEFAHLILATLDQNLTNPQVWDDWFAYSSRLGATLRLCDGAITTNDFLAKQIKDFSSLPVSIIPNFVNHEQLTISDRIYTKKNESETIDEKEKIHLGYFSGSPSHNRDFAIIVPALKVLLEENDSLVLVVVGYIDINPTLERFGSRVKCFPFHDFINLQRLIGSVEFNLMPLQCNIFTDCKSELKYFEAAIVGTLSIASPSHTYAAAIQDGKNGYIAQSHQWASVIQHAIENIGKYQEMAATTHDHARSKYAWFNQREIILQALGLK